MGEREGKINEAWERILDAHPGMLEAAAEGKTYRITADEIKRFYEPRLLTKHDTAESVPAPLKDAHINVLSVSRREYELGQFSLFSGFESLRGIKPEIISLPDYETLRVEQIDTEPKSINALVLSKALDRFLDTSHNEGTFGGRMGSGEFEFDVENLAAGASHISVHGAQIEIDGGFENEDSVVIMEAKSIIHDNFNVRQLYYPFRKYLALVKKPIRLVFSQYTNFAYNLYEYVFDDPMSYSSIRLAQARTFAFENTRISSDDMLRLCKKTKIVADDNQSHTRVPFIQADRFDRVISLMEYLYGLSDDDWSGTDDIAEFMGTTIRQASYYPSAGEYLGVFERKPGFTRLSARGRDIMRRGYYERQSRLAELMFGHAVLHNAYLMMVGNGRVPTADEIIPLMRECNVCNDGATIRRRARSVIGWMRWLQAITDDGL